VIIPRGFTSLQTKEEEYSFSGFIPTNKQTNYATGAARTIRNARTPICSDGMFKDHQGHNCNLLTEVVNAHAAELV